jgi:hypothetical protein
MMLCACHRRSRASLHRLSFSMTCISWPVRLCSAADCSSAAATGPARSAVKCVDKEKGRSNGSFSLRPLSSLERFCVRHGGRFDSRSQMVEHRRAAPSKSTTMLHSGCSAAQAVCLVELPVVFGTHVWTFPRMSRTASSGSFESAC